MRTPTWFKSLMLSSSLLILGVSPLAYSEVPVDPSRVESAKSAADHQEIAHAYELEATRLDQEAAMHAKLANAYGSHLNAKMYSPAMEHHCKALEKQYKESAALYRDLAALHRKIALESPH